MTIELYVDHRYWMAKYSGEGSQGIRRLFGTDVLPTAYTDDAEMSTVLAGIKALNPNDDVRMLG